MIIGIGCDIADIERIETTLERFGDNFLKHILSDFERTQIHGPKATFLAGRFAAKEACAKAFGTGFSQGLSMPQIEVTNDERGRPSLIFQGEAQVLAKHLGVRRSFLSISHERKFAVAYVVLEGDLGC
ncbi:MAG: holo-ACP synthase [Desulfovibrionaceae bacterium]|nr:holo-ACP synthase [Desulfovibrionaceae bacterium]